MRKQALIFCIIILLGACNPHLQATQTVPSIGTNTLTPEIIILPTNTQIPGPAIIDLITLTPTIKYGVVLAFGEQDLIDQQYGTFSLHANHYPTSIFAPAPSVLEYNLDRQYTHFVASIFMSDSPGEECIGHDPDGVFFVVELDGKVIFRSPQFFYNTSPQKLQLDVTSGSSLRLEVYSTTNIGINDPKGECDDSIWGDPYLTMDHPKTTIPASEKPIARPTLIIPKISGDSVADFYVAPNGKDMNSGSIDQPFATIQHARDVVRTINQDMAGPINIYIRGGLYQIAETVMFSNLDSGSNGHDILYQAYPGETPIISGGTEVAGFELVAGKPYWVIRLPETTNLFRNLYVNGKRATRAQTEKTVMGTGWWKGDWSERDGIVMDLTGPGWWVSDWGFWPGINAIMNPAGLPTFQRPQDLELHWIMDWVDVRSPVENIIPTENHQIVFQMKQPYFSWAENLQHIGEESKWMPRWDVPFIIENALELMDQPGEWYYNPSSYQLFYFPRDNESPQTSQAVIPQLDVLMQLKGDSLEAEIHNLQFVGLTFAYNSWMRASVYGTASPIANELSDGECALFCGGGFAPSETFTPAAIQIDHASDLQFSGNIIQHTGSVGIGLNNDVYNTRIVGNFFTDLSDAAITLGHLYDQAYIDQPGEGIVHDILVKNNLVYRSGQEYWGAHSIIGYFVRNVEISHNQVQEIPNSGISIYGGTASNFSTATSTGFNSILDNRVDHASLRGINGSPEFGGDAGGIYTSGNWSDSIIKGNYVSNILNNYTCIYLDLNLYNELVSQNVCENARQWIAANLTEDTDILMEDNYTNIQVAIDIANPHYFSESNVYNDPSRKIFINQTHYVHDGQWPPDGLKIIANAGLESKYQSLLDLINR